MNYYCPNCKAYYTQPDDQIPPEGMTVKCLDCGTLISLTPPRRQVPDDEQETVTLGPSLDGMASRAPAVPALPATAHEDDLTVPSVGPESHAPAARLAPAVSGAGWRLSSLWGALREAFDVKRNAQAGLILFVAALAVVIFHWLGAQTGNAGLRAGTMVLGLALAWMVVGVLAGGLTASVHDSLARGKVTPLGRGLAWALAHLPSVVLTPLVLLGMGLTLVLVEALLHLLGMLPGIGPLMYGLVFGVILFLSLAVAGSLAGSMAVGFVYLPKLVTEDRGPIATVREVLGLYSRQGGTMALAILATTGASAVLVAALTILGGVAVVLSLTMGFGLLGDEFLASFRAMPGSGLLTGLISGMVDAPAGPGSSAAGVLMGLGLLLWGCFLAAFVLTFLCAAGVVTFYLATGRDRS